MKLNEQTEETFENFANGISNLSYWLVIITCFSSLTLFLFFVFVNYIGIVYKDRDVVEWCEEYHPNWTYEQCESMVGR